MTASCIAPQGARTAKLSYELFFSDQISGSPFPNRTIQFVMRVTGGGATLYQVDVPASQVLFTTTCTFVPFGSGTSQQCVQRFEQTLDIASLTANASAPIGLFVNALTTSSPPTDSDSASIDATLSIVPEQVSVKIQRPPSWAGNGDGSPRVTLRLTPIPNGGQVSWSSGDPSKFALETGGASPVAVFRAAQLPAKAEIRVRYTSPSGAVGEDSITLVASTRATIVMWPNGDQVPQVAATTTRSFDILSDPYACIVALGAWGLAAVVRFEVPFLSTFHLPTTDVPFANTFLIRRGYGDDPRPPSSISPTQFLLARTNFRAGQDFQVGFEVDVAGKLVEPVFAFTALSVAGKTPEPCSGTRLYLPLPGPLLDPDVSSLNGSVWTDSGRSSVFQVVNLRVGPAGQAVDTYLNDRQCSALLCRFGQVGVTTPWIWSSLTFNADGAVQESGLQQAKSIFPTLTLYRQGTVSQEIVQGSLFTLIGFDQSYTYAPPAGSRRIILSR